MRWTLCIAVALLVLWPAPAAAQDVVVRASVDKPTVGSEERLTYSLEIDGASYGDVETPGPPSTTGFALLQRTPSIQRNMSIANGVIRQSVTFRWTYRPLSTGEARFGAVSVTVNDRSYASDPIDITVVDQSLRPNQQASRQQWPFAQRTPPQEKSQGNALQTSSLFIRAVPNKISARQNEQITVEYQLFFRDGIRLRHSRLAGSWDAEGFWREEFNVDARPVPRTVVENGTTYHMIVLKRVAVFPTRPGTLTIDPLEIETEAYVPSGSGDPFERFFSLRGQFQTVELASQPVRLHVEPLPDSAPDTFSGAVGQYDVQYWMEDARVDVGEPLEITVTVHGTGNLATLAAPHFDPPSVFDRYEPDVSSTIDRDGRLIRGSKTFSYVLVPRSNGTYAMPPIRLSYFDPSMGRYVEATSQPPSVQVTGTAAPVASGTTSDGLPVDDIASIMTGVDGWHALSQKPLHRRSWPYAALGLPLGLLLLLYGYQRRSDRYDNDRQFARSRMAHPLARKHLRAAQQLFSEGRPRAFYEEIERAVSGFIGNRLNIAETGLTRDQLDLRLDTVGLPDDDRRLLRVLLDECDQARFAPVLPGRHAMESARDRAAHLIVSVDDAVAKHRSGTEAA